MNGIKTQNSRNDHATKEFGTKQAGDLRTAQAVKIRPSKNVEEKVVLKLAADDIGFVLGHKGKVKRKLQSVSHAKLDLDSDSMELTITGTDLQRWKGKALSQLVIEQRHGVPKIDLNDDWPLITFIPLPGTSFKYVTGKNGSLLRELEEEYNCFMLLVDPWEGGIPKVFKEPSDKILAVFGTRKGRVAAKMRIISKLSQLIDGYLGVPGRNSGSRNDYMDTEEMSVDPRTELTLDERIKSVLMERKGDDDAEFGDDDEAGKDQDTWDADEIALPGEKYAYCLGKGGSTKMKVAHSSGAVIELFSEKAVIIGSRTERARATEYIHWLFDQKNGICHVNDPEERTDCTIVDIAKNVAGFVHGKKGENFREIEKKTGTYLMFQRYYDESKAPQKGVETVLILSWKRNARMQARDLICDRVDEKNHLDQGENGRKRDRDHGYNDRERRDSRDRYRDRRSRSRSSSRRRDRRNYRPRSNSPDYRRKRR